MRVDAEPFHAGHARDGFPTIVAFNHENRPNEVARRKSRFAKHIPNPRKAAIPPHSSFRKSAEPIVVCHRKSPGRKRGKDEIN